MKRAVLVVLVVALAACTGGGSDGVGAPDVPADPEVAAAASEPEARAAEPRALAQSGTDSVAGALVRLCEGDECERVDGARGGALPLADSGLLLFVLSEPPQEAGVEIRRRGKERVVDGGPLEVSDLMAYQASLREGRYDVTLTARWPDAEASWAFVVRVR